MGILARSLLTRAVRGPLLAAVLAGVAIPVLAGGAASAATPRPQYSDPSAQGYIGLCDEQGRQITSGSVNAAPFAWRAVSSVAAVPPYNDAWRTAVLLAFQPQQGLEAEEWSGQALTDSARYTNAAHPMAAATHADDSLADFMAFYRPVWDGWLELRLYLGTRNAEVYSYRYPVLNIHVVGSRWYAVGGGDVNCASGRAVSIESIVLPASRLTSPGAPAVGGARSTSTRTASSRGTTSRRASQASGTSTAATVPSSSNTSLIVIIGLLLLAAIGTLVLWRMRSTHAPRTIPVHDQQGESL